MADLEALFRAVDKLTPEERDQLLAYVQKKLEQYEQQSQPRTLDLHKGKIRTSSDFDDELPDSFWLGEE